MIELDIYYNTDETSKLEELEIKVDLDDCELKKTLFITIDAVSPYEGNRTLIYSSGDIFVCALSYKELKKILSERYN